MVKVCHITSVHNINDVRIYHKQILSLINAGYHVDYIVKEGELIDKPPGVTCHLLNPKPRLLTRVKNQFRILKISYKLESEIFQLHDPELIIIGFILKWIFKRKIIYDIHELYADSILHKSYLYPFIATILSKIYQIIEKFVLKYFDHIILAEMNYDKYYKNNKYTVIQNYALSKSLINKKSLFNSDESDLNIVYLGGVTKERGIFEILEFVNELKNDVNLIFHLIGPIIPNSLKLLIEDYLMRNNIKNIVRIYDWLPMTQSHKIMENCDVGLIFLHPIHNYTTSLATKMFEYMAKGLVVIMSDFPLWTEFNNTYKCGLTVDIFNIKQEKQRILEFFEQKNKIKSIREKNVETVKNNFLWEIEEKKLLRLYDHLINT